MDIRTLSKGRQNWLIAICILGLLACFIVLGIAGWAIFEIVTVPPITETDTPVIITAGLM